MSILIFIVILGVLILVHEFGHFIIAKKSGVRVDEFGVGFPPRLFKLFRWKGTDFTFNAIPFGGFVKIFGENPEEGNDLIENQNSSEHFAHKTKKVQALILFGGVLFNFIFAWFLISVGFVHGLPSAVDLESKYVIEDAKLVLTSILNESPAFNSGLQIGDEILQSKNSGVILDTAFLNADNFSDFINESEDTVLITIKRNDQILEIDVLPKEGIVTDRKAIGVALSKIGTLKLPLHLALYEGLKTSSSLIWDITRDLFGFFGRIFLGKADFSQVTGPVGIVGLVGDASKLGFIYLLQFTAFISLNLTVINLIPFPALDGGRLLFLGIETIKGSKMNPKIVNNLNIIGFLVLLLLMVLVTISDVLRIW